MKHTYKIAMLLVALLFTMSAFASNKNSVDFTLTKAATVYGTTLQPGDDKVVLDRTGDNIQATFVKSGKTVATTAGHFEQRTSFPGPGVSLVVHDGDRALQQILVEKMKGAVVLDEGAAASAGH